MTDRALSYIGIARKAGRLAIGTPNVCDALRRVKSGVVFAARDISPATRKRLSDKCAFYGARLCELDIDSAGLAHIVGKTGCVAAVAITDEGLAKSSLNAYDAPGGASIK